MVNLQVLSRDTVPLAGHEEMVGAISSLSVMVKEHEEEFPAASVAVSVMSCEVLCPLNTVPAAGD